jgi:putative glycosyltransferase (TIGR04372 family)
MTPCDWPGVVDAATAPWRIPAFELWAVLNARFLICGDSGPYLLGLLSGAPAVSVNVFRVGYNTIGPKDLYIAKRVFDRVRGRFLSVAEQLDESFLRGEIDLDRYEWTDNTPEEILEAVQDMVQQLGEPGAPRTEAQLHHDRLIAELDKRWSPEWPSERLLFRRGGRGTMAPRFASQHLVALTGRR